MIFSGSPALVEVRLPGSKVIVPGVNLVAVRVDNSLQPNSRWYTGSGIYRHVWLTTVAPLHVGHWGTYLTTPVVDSAAAEVVVRTRVENDRAVPRRGVLRAVVLRLAIDHSPAVVPRGNCATAGSLSARSRVNTCAPFSPGINSTEVAVRVTSPFARENRSVSMVAGVTSAR